MKKYFRRNLIFPRRGSGYAKGAIVMAAALSLLMYFAVIQGYQVFYGMGSPDAAAFCTFLNHLLKGTVMILAASLMWYFYSMQEYSTALNDLMDIFSIHEEGEDLEYPYAKNQELASLLDSAAGVIQTNKVYQSQLEGQKKLILSNYIMRLMKGRGYDIPAIYESGESLGVDLRTGCLQVIVFGITGGGEQLLREEAVDETYGLVRVLINSMLLELFNGYLTEVDGMLACLVIPQPGEKLDSKESVTELKRIAMLIRQIVLDKRDQVIRIAAGSVCAGISGIEKSFSEAMEIFQYAEITKDDDSILVYREMPSVHMVDTDDYFWFKKEMQFMSCINTADFTSAATVLYEILDSEYINSDLPLKLINCRMLGLINAMINALGKIRLTVDADFFEQLAPWDTILNCKSLPELKQCSKEIFDCINHYTENQKRQSAYCRMTEIVEYVKDNFNDPNISVSLVADYFHLNPSYLSRIFKKLMGVGLADYIQWIRVEEAKELLLKGHLSIREVAEMVGYSGVQTMNRAFKKIEGKTAGKIRHTE